MIIAISSHNALALSLIGIIGIAVPLWALIDAATRPSAAFAVAGSSKLTWILLIVILTLLTGIIGLVVSVVYLVSIRPKLRAAA